MIGDRLSAMRLYRAEPPDRAAVQQWMNDNFGEETLNRCLSVTLIEGGVRLELMSVDGDGRIALDDRGDLQRELIDVTECPEPPAGEWRRCMAAPLLATEIGEDDGRPDDDDRR